MAVPSETITSSPNTKWMIIAACHVFSLSWRGAEGANTFCLERLPAARITATTLIGPFRCLIPGVGMMSLLNAKKKLRLSEARHCVPVTLHPHSLVYKSA